jgi:AbrB family looped-hinge helix DNA binding protein
MKLTIVGSRGRITLLKQIRERLRLRAGDRVEFVVEGKGAVMRRFGAGANPFKKYSGVLRAFPGGKKEINAWLNELRGGRP